MDKSTYITYMLSHNFHTFAALLGFILAGSLLSLSKRTFPVRCVGVGLLWLTALHTFDHMRWAGKNVLFTVQHMRTSSLSEMTEMQKLQFLSARLEYGILITAGVSAFVLAIVMTAKLASAHRTERRAEATAGDATG